MVAPWWHENPVSAYSTGVADTGITRRKRADGTTAYRVTWREGGTRNGPRRSRTVDKLGDAKALYAAIVANGYKVPDDLATALPVVARVARNRPGGPTFADYGREHIGLRTGIGDGQRNALLRDLDRHMAPAFGHLRLSELDDKTVRGWLRGLEDGSHPWLDDDSLAPRTRRRLVTQAGAIMGAAVAEGLVDRNPFHGIRIGREDHDRHEEQVILTHDEWALLRSEILQDVGRGVADMLIGTGARWGEVTALAVEHVDPDERTVRITRSWQNDGKGGAKLGPTKSRKSRRTVEIGKRTLVAIEPFLEGRQESELLFAARNGERLRAPNYWRDVWRPAVQRARNNGLTKSPRIHDLRHTHVSWLIAANVPLAVIQRRLGHDSITTTIDTYGHMLPTAEAAATDAIDDALGD